MKKKRKEDLISEKDFDVKADKEKSDVINQSMMMKLHPCKETPKQAIKEDNQEAPRETKKVTF